MMTKEEYQKNLIRMWDSIRSDYKGENRCAGVDCTNCPFNGKVCYTEDGRIPFHAYEAIEIVENWAKENPIKTNADKFREVFGFEPYTKNCINGEEKVSCTNCQCFYDGECAAHNRFWNAEYKGKTEGCEEE